MARHGSISEQERGSARSLVRRHAHDAQLARRCGGSCGGRDRDDGTDLFATRPKRRSPGRQRCLRGSLSAVIVHPRRGRGRACDAAFVAHLVDDILMPLLRRYLSVLSRGPAPDSITRRLGDMMKQYAMTVCGHDGIYLADVPEPVASPASGRAGRGRSLNPGALRRARQFVHAGSRISPVKSLRSRRRCSASPSVTRCWAGCRLGRPRPVRRHPAAQLVSKPQVLSWDVRARSTPHRWGPRRHPGGLNPGRARRS